MTWSIVATVFEPAPLVEAFVAHHLRLGASQIFVFLDQANPALEHDLDRVPQCEVVVCTEAYWRRCGGRDPVPVERQKHNAQIAYDKTATDWLVHLDADEFIVNHAALAPMLASSAPDVGVVRLPVAERAHLEGAPIATIFDGVFRLPATTAVADRLTEIYGDRARFLNHGVKAYGHYKSFVRTGLDLTLGVHSPLALARSPYRAVAAAKPSLLHFDGLTPRSWALKMARKRALENLAEKKNEARVQQILQAPPAGDRLEPGMALFDELDTLSATAVNALDDQGLIWRHAFDPRADVAAVFGWRSWRFSPDEFDAHFMAMN